MSMKYFLYLSVGRPTVCATIRILVHTFNEYLVARNIIGTKFGLDFVMISSPHKAMHNKFAFGCFL